MSDLPPPPFETPVSDGRYPAGTLQLYARGSTFPRQSAGERKRTLEIHRKPGEMAKTGPF